METRSDEGSAENVLIADGKVGSNMTDDEAKLADEPSKKDYLTYWENILRKFEDNTKPEMEDNVEKAQASSTLENLLQLGVELDLKSIVEVTEEPSLKSKAFELESSHHQTDMSRTKNEMTEETDVEKDLKKFMITSTSTNVSCHMFQIFKQSKKIFQSLVEHPVANKEVTVIKLSEFPICDESRKIRNILDHPVQSGSEKLHMHTRIQVDSDEENVLKNSNTAVPSTRDPVSVQTECLVCECCECKICICERKIVRGASEEEMIAPVKKELLAASIPKPLDLLDAGKSETGSTSSSSEGENGDLDQKDKHPKYTDKGEKSEESRWRSHLYMDHITGIDEMADDESTLFSHVGFDLATHLSTYRPLAKKISCDCLPGFCKCRKTHWTLRKAKLSIETSKQRGIYKWKDNECPCIHEGDKLYPSSEGSEEEIIASPILSKIEQLEICSYKNTYQQTLVMVKPDAMIFQDVIKRAFVYVGGLNIVNERILCLTPEQVSDIYSEQYYGKLNFPLFVLQMSRYPILVLSLGGLNAIEVVKSMVGPDRMIPESWFFPESIIRKIGTSADIPEAMHVSADFEKAALENRYFFPDAIVHPFPRTPEKVHDYCNKYINPILNRGLAAVAVNKPEDPVSFLAEWLLMHNPYRPFYEPKSINMVPT